VSLFLYFGIDKMCLSIRELILITHEPLITQAPSLTLFYKVALSIQCKYRSERKPEAHGHNGKFYDQLAAN
jgi:hypothetical protein